MKKNMFEQSLFSEQSLYLLTLKELRIMGRNFGVPSPTTKNKKELVDYILGVVYGKVKVPVRNVYGRKPLGGGIDMDSCIEKLRKNSQLSDEFKSFSMTDENYSSFPASDNLGYGKVSSPSGDYDTEDVLETRIYCLSNNKHKLKLKAFIDSPDDIEISESFAKKFNLENQDVVEISLRGNLIKLLSVNGIKKEDKFGELSVSGQQLTSAFSQVFYLRTKEEIKVEIKNLISSCAKSDLKAAIFSDSEYDAGVIGVKYEETEDKTRIYKKLMNFAGLCEEAVLSGEDVVIIFEDEEWLKNVFSEFDTDVFMRLEKNLKEIFTKIIRLGNVLIAFNTLEECVY